MGLVNESPRSRGWNLVPGFGRAMKMIGAKSIFRTSQTEVKIKRISGRKISFLARGELQTLADETVEAILQRIVHTLIPSRTEQSDRRIARHGKESAMDASVSFTRETLPALSEESLRHLDEIKRRAAIRKARRLANEQSVKIAGRGVQPTGRKAVTIKSSKGKLISLS